MSSWSKTLKFYYKLVVACSLTYRLWLSISSGWPTFPLILPVLPLFVAAYNVAPAVLNGRSCFNRVVSQISTKRLINIRQRPIPGKIVLFAVKNYFGIIRQNCIHISLMMKTRLNFFKRGNVCWKIWRIHLRIYVTIIELLVGWLEFCYVWATNDKIESSWMEQH